MRNRPDHWRATAHEIIARYVDPPLRPLLEKPPAGVRLGEDLGLDSLALMEVVQRFEDKLAIVIPDAELRQMRTLAEVDDAIERAFDSPQPEVSGSRNLPRNQASAG